MSLRTFNPPILCLIQFYIHTDRQTNRQTDILTLTLCVVRATVNIARQVRGYATTDRQPASQPASQPGRQAGRQAGRQTDRHIYIHALYFHLISFPLDTAHYALNSGKLFFIQTRGSRPSRGSCGSSVLHKQPAPKPCAYPRYPI